jgi:RNA polymerase sigma-70 factor (ECF subfamily)
MIASFNLPVEQRLALARSGDQNALGDLLESYRGYLVLLARVQIGRRLQGKVEPGDVVQEVFLAAYQAFPNFRGLSEGELVAWLRRILASRLANLVRHYWGTGRRDVGLERELEYELDQSSRLFAQALIADQSSPSQQAARREQAVLLAEALDKLPADYREVLILRHLEGLTFPEVARRVGRSLDSVEKVWMRALGKLRRALGGESTSAAA